MAGEAYAYKFNHFNTDRIFGNQRTVLISVTRLALQDVSAPLQYAGVVNDVAVDDRHNRSDFL
jgi:hypothetical protein